MRHATTSWPDSRGVATFPPPRMTDKNLGPAVFLPNFEGGRGEGISIGVYARVKKLRMKRITQYALRGRKETLQVSSGGKLSSVETPSVWAVVEQVVRCSQHPLTFVHDRGFWGVNFGPVSRYSRP